MTEGTLSEQDMPPGYGLRQRIGWLVGPTALLLTLLLPPPDGLSIDGWHTAGVGLFMAAFWIAEPIPIFATALLPLVLFPALGLSDIQESAAPVCQPDHLSVPRRVRHRAGDAALAPAPASRDRPHRNARHAASVDHRRLSARLRAREHVGQQHGHVADDAADRPVGRTPLPGYAKPDARAARLRYGAAARGCVRRDNRRNGHAHRHAAQRLACGVHGRRLWDSPSASASGCCSACRSSS